MRILVQRVAEAWVEIEDVPTRKAGRGLLGLIGFHQADEAALVAPMAEKFLNLRIFEDAQKRMNLSLLDVAGDLVVVPQFTLYADCRKGRRPGFSEALEPERAKTLFTRFQEACRATFPEMISGEFGATMQVHLVNHGPVTILLDSSELFPIP